MAVANEGNRRVAEQGCIDRVQHLADAANPAFAAGSLLVPLAFFAASLALGSTELLFYTHVAAGAVWFGFALIFPAVIGPTLGGLDEAAAAAVNRTLIPKAVFFLVGFSLTTVLSGTVLLTPDIGLGYGFGGTWSGLALGLGWGLFAFGLAVPHRLHLSAYYETVSPDPDADRLESIEKKNLVVGLFEGAMMLALIVLMTGFRLG
ncbi:hypothetical protein EXE48_15415 [Halorubrum sp. ASP1]|uniref:DUF2269 family protein n=1 Tax=Halorubrum tropicale TaxID=1765655 RepID=A0A0M9ASR8_9EURY|nr:MULTISPECIES: hypothetical protein [Halorubrum]KOX97065.1 hypothetical protein AMR74_06470 [Halorubrum tropicale]RLM51602.1 hypothetical protein DVK06_04175 [Halorubrum sp. Atlit-28R]TKX59174.1 hypothetical protein EXE48_15415 [Halorubrum sp. ASP1]